ncbi:hypothetical protein [Bythopirellula polymerisocia]|uniref:KOW domain-containing protein n=1 Tax=Bythopirellula polymerisocia TaxID=2528003 RepID=A0A5C6CUL8_9BACT|nr:hypothetical protein [Bythopirellula polymerisocia]TWU27344.1 hypothetical protein Pla144_21160 [Bythopirellula polymerisocia]
MDLNHRIVARLKFLRQMRAHADMLEFSIGERVEFDSGGGGLKAGVLTKYNRKTVTVITDSGEQWNIAPCYLRSVAESRTSQPIEPQMLEHHKK